MLISMLTLAIIAGLFFRSITVFMFGLGGLLFLFYPVQLITLLFVGGAIYLLIRSNKYELPKLHSRSDRDVE